MSVLYTTVIWVMNVGDVPKKLLRIEERPVRYDPGDCRKVTRVVKGTFGI